MDIFDILYLLRTKECSGRPNKTSCKVVSTAFVLVIMDNAYIGI